jgi:hypothetical protein
MIWVFWLVRGSVILLCIFESVIYGYVVLLCGKFPLWVCVFSLGRCQCVSLLNYKSVILASVLCNL